MGIAKQLIWVACCLALSPIKTFAQQSDPPPEPSSASRSPISVIQYGEMHEVIGQKQHQARVRLGDLLKHPHFYAVGAIEKLQGEITIDSSRAIVTTVDSNKLPLKYDEQPENTNATLLIGAYVENWSEHPIDASLTDEELDVFIERMANANGLDTSKPFMFMITGEFSKVDLHVINGACPVHARIRKLTIPVENAPYEATMDLVSGKVMGVFAKDAAGQLTHPSTSTHKHLIYTRPGLSQLLTAHVESMNVNAGSKLSIPRIAGR